MPHRSPLEFGCEDYWIWDTKTISNGVVIPEPHVVIFRPLWSCSTSAVRGNKILNNGKHFWELDISNRFFGTSLMFGVGKGSAKLRVPYLTNLIGEDDSSWGLNHKGIAIHNRKTIKYTSPFEFDKPILLGILFDGAAGTLTYFKNGKCLGVAFKGLDKIDEPLYPMVASTSATKQKVILTKTIREFINLQDMCRSVIAQTMACPSQLDNLYLPPSIKVYIKKSLFTETNDITNCFIPDFVYRKSSINLFS